MSDLKPYIATVADGNALSREETGKAFDIIMSGEATPSQIGGFLMALRVRGETTDEFAGAIDTMRMKMLPVDAPDDAMDIVGTGGDGKGSYNVSTASAFVVAGCGVKVAKHGNRALSSRAGTADTLLCLGINQELSPGQITDCIEEAGIGFMFAPAHHSAMRFVGPSRVELGTRTIFNLLGPMCNPAGVKRQLMGVFSPIWLLEAAKVFRQLGTEKVWVVHGQGYDELTITGTSQVAALENGEIKTFEINPEDYGLKTASEEDITGGDGKHNAEVLKRLLEGEPSAYADMVLLNSAAALMIAEKVSSMEEGIAAARESITSGNAANALNKLVEVSNR